MRNLDLDPEKRVLVIGAGKSGISAGALLVRNGYRIAVYDGNVSLTEKEIRHKAAAFDVADIYIGEIPEEAYAGFSMAVISPGVSGEKEPAVSLRAHSVPIIGEIELAYRFAKGKIVGITGTNGKTTTTSLTGEILKTHFSNVHVVGNIGIPFTDIADLTDENTVTVIELSSFQLETVDRFHADVSAILNLTPDHLDRHHTMEAYFAAKCRVTNGQTKEDLCVLNAADPWTGPYAAQCPASAMMFSSAGPLDDGLYLDGDTIMQAKGGERNALMDVHEMKLVGRCNAENVMAAIAMGEAIGVPMEKILDAVRTFTPVPHRIEYVAEKNGVKYYNDSKGTNPDAAIQGIRAMETQTCLIGGGYDKGAEYDDWILAFDGKVKQLVLIGQTAPKIARTARRYGVENIVFADTLEDAVRVCADAACPGEAVLLSPACASWDMFPNYEVRGDKFKEYVRAIQEH